MVAAVPSSERRAIPELVFVNVCGAQKSIPMERSSSYVAWRAGTTNRVVVQARHAGNRFLDSPASDTHVVQGKPAAPHFLLQEVVRGG